MIFIDLSLTPTGRGAFPKTPNFWGPGPTLVFLRSSAIPRIQIFDHARIRWYKTKRFFTWSVSFRNDVVHWCYVNIYCRLYTYLYIYILYILTFFVWGAWELFVGGRNIEEPKKRFVFFFSHFTCCYSLPSWESWLFGVATAETHIFGVFLESRLDHTPNQKCQLDEHGFWQNN